MSNFILNLVHILLVDVVVSLLVLKEGRVSGLESSDDVESLLH